VFVDVEGLSEYVPFPVIASVVDLDPSTPDRADGSNRAGRSGFDTPPLSVQSFGPGTNRRPEPRS
jgi:hypothetical protein